MSRFLGVIIAFVISSSAAIRPKEKNGDQPVRSHLILKVTGPSETSAVGGPAVVRALTALRRRF
jgi:hypothetical protein